MIQNKFRSLLSLFARRFPLTWFARYERPAMILAASAALTAILMSLEFNLLEANLYDLRMSMGTQPRPDSRIALVTVDDRTTKALDEFSPLTLDVHARFLEALEKLQPKAVGYLVDLNRVNEANPDHFDGVWGQRFVETAKRMERNGVPILLGTPFDVTGEVLPPYPLSALPHSIAIVHKDGNVFAEDKITRRALTHLYDKPVFHTELARKITRDSYAPESVRGSYYVPEVDGQYFFFRYHGSTVASPPGQAVPRTTSYPRYSFIDILRGDLSDRDALKDKIILVGTLTREDSGDFVLTPYSKQAFANPKIVVHANILDSLLNKQSIQRVPPWLNWFTTFLVTSIIFWQVLTSTPLRGVFSTVGLSLIFMVFAQALFSLKGVWIRESQPLIGIFLGYYLVVPYRLIVEYKKRWDYQRKNEILVQVEELKTNFLSLITHDLKTPVARIQGLTEVLLRRLPGRSSRGELLLEQDKENLENIIHSTDELNRFITSVLELTKVESNALRLNLESKDLNQIIERSIQSFDPQARARQINLHAELEPLFPIKVDASLISKVINNLIDNALKYSPGGSQIWVQSRETEGWVEISVKDQGIGMTPEELGNLFTRFYRAKNDTTTRIIGTGLGLYLTKYFIEAHGGQVQVDSQKDRGSVFTIRLPIAPPVQQSRENGATEPASAGKPGLYASQAFTEEKQRRKVLAKENANV